MSVADLTGTTWQFNSSLVLGTHPHARPEYDYALTFTSNGAGYNGLGLVLNKGMTAFSSVMYSSTTAYTGDAWVSEAYRTITITGGSTSTNADLIAWIEENATQVVVSPPVVISYNGNEIASMSATGTKTLLTEGRYCEDDITVAYTAPSAPAPNLQAKSNISPTLSSQTITADNGYDGLSSVQINAMPSGSATTPATTITANPSISVSSGGLITASVSKSQNVTPTVSAGYVSSGTYGTVTVSGSNTNQLSTKAAQTYTPTTTNQTIASGQYLSGAQTIKGDANLAAGNIKDGVTIFGVTGNYTGGGGGGGGGTVTITLYNPYDSSAFQYLDIYEGTYDNVYGVVEGDYLDSIDSPTGSATVTVTAPANALVLRFGGSYVYLPRYFEASMSGGIGLFGGLGLNFMTDGSSEALMHLLVSGDGTLDLFGIAWDD